MTLMKQINTDSIVLREAATNHPRQGERNNIRALRAHSRLKIMQNQRAQRKTFSKKIRVWDIAMQRAQRKVLEMLLNKQDFLLVSLQSAIFRALRVRCSS